MTENENTTQTNELTANEPIGQAIVDEPNEIDAEFENLFSAFDDVSASEFLKASTIAAITESQQGEKPRAVATGTVSKPSRKARFRAIRVAAIAACLVMALTGGAAYAIPASTVAVTQGDTTVSLGVNVFGVIVSATSDSVEGEKVVESSEPLFKPYEEGLVRMVDALDERNAEHDRLPIDVRVESGDPGQRERLEEKGEPFVSQHNAAIPQPDAGEKPAGPAGFAGSVEPQGDVPQGDMPQVGQGPGGDNSTAPNGQIPNDPHDNDAHDSDANANGIPQNEPANAPAPQGEAAGPGDNEGGSASPARP